MEDGGWIKFHRKYLNGKIFKNALTNQVFVWILLKVQHDFYYHPTSFGVIPLKPGQVCISSEKMAEILGQTRQNIRTALKAIKSTGAVTSEVTKGISVITLVKWEDYQGLKHKLTSEVTSELTRPQPGPNQALTTEQECKNERMKEKEYTPEFLAFWNLYPRKNAQRDAFKAWLKLNPNEALQTVLKSAVQTQSKSADWQKENGQFIPYAATWLNGQRWKDELKPVEKRSHFD